MNRAAFDAYIETQLAPTLQPGDVPIADKLSSHKSARAQSLLKAQGSWMLFLPPYSTDLNPIEIAYSKLKARTFDTLFQSVAQRCELFPPDECRNIFKAAGYVAYERDAALAGYCNAGGFTNRSFPFIMLVMK